MSASSSRPWFIVRLACWCWRLVWSRRTAGALAVVVLLAVLYYRWENVRSARELEDAHRRMVDRIGTDDPLKLVSPPAADEDNYFANPTIVSWGRSSESGGLIMEYEPPVDELLPSKYKPEIRSDDSDDTSVIDLAGWALMCSKGGDPVPSDVPLEDSLARVLGDGNGLIPKLSIGLDRPFSMMKPARRELLQAAGATPWNVDVIGFKHLNPLMKNLALHLRSAALVGDQEKVLSTALILLRFAQGFENHALGGGICSLATSKVAFEALHAALGSQGWTEASLAILQHELSRTNDLSVIERALSEEMITMHQFGHHLRMRRVAGELLPAFQWGPVGWLDADAAFYTNAMLNILGPPGELAWLSGDERRAEDRRMMNEAQTNLRHVIGAVAVPNVGNLFENAAITLFHRRCLIIACTLERYRLQHGNFPDALEAVKSELAAYKTNDPALSDQPLGYRGETSGYLLWSAGADATDDGGTPANDLLWRMKRADATTHQ